MKEFLRVSLKKYCPAKDVETYLSLIFATAITFIAVKSSAYSLVLEMMPDIKPFIIGVIGGSIALLGISVSGIAIVIAMFTVEDIEHINTIKPGAFKELLWDFKFFAFHIAGGIIVLSIAYFGEYIAIPPLPAKILTYCTVFYIVHFLVFTTLYCAGLVGNCMKLSALKQTLYKASRLEKTIYEQINEMISERLVAALSKSHGLTIEEFYMDLIASLQKSDLTNRNEIIRYLEQRYHLPRIK